MWIELKCMSCKQKWRCKEFDDWSSYKNKYIWNPKVCDCKCGKVCKINKYLNIKNCSCKKCPFLKLVLACEDEILNATDTSFKHKKVTREKNNCLIHTNSFAIISLLLLVIICISCYYYRTLHWIKKEHVFSHLISN